MRIGIYGGTFAPVHLGHVTLAETAIHQLSLDRLIVVPAGLSPGKQKDDALTDQDRLLTCRLAFASLPNTEVSDVEVCREGKSYTVDTLQLFREKYPKDTLICLFGSDAFLGLERWRAKEEIFSLAEIAVMPRDEKQRELTEQKAVEYRLTGASATVLEGPAYPVSSSLVREYLERGEQTDLIPEKVLSYFRQNGRFGFSAEDYEYDLPFLTGEIERLESPERYEHSLNVAKRAVELARIHHVSEKLAYLAGLLHDICKNLPREEQLKWVPKPVILRESLYLKLPQLWHAMAAAPYLWENYGVYQLEVLSGIFYHTEGHPGMTTFEKVIYLADLTSAERDYPSAAAVRAICDESLDRGMIEGLRYTAYKLRQTKTPMTESARELMNEYDITL